MRLKSHLLAILLLCSTAAFAQSVVPSGTTIKVRTDQAIPASPANGAAYTATVSEDVQDGNGTVIIPRGSRASLVAQSNEDGKDRVLDLRSVTVNGRRYLLTAAGQAGTASGGGAGYGMNKRTGLYVGGGAAVGAILGGLLGGGKGAALGAILGGAGGAGAQKVTGGKNKNIPAETELSYKLAQDLQMQRWGGARRNGAIQQR
jgi:hypothetical protein